MIRIEQCSLERLQAIAMSLGKLLVNGDVVMLTGDVGAGKTTFTRALARGMGIDDPIQSPSFTIVNHYTSVQDKVRLAHYDFYRLSDAGIMKNELNESIHDAVVVVEWAEIVRDALPKDILSVGIETADEETRNLTFSALGPRATELLEGVRHDIAT